MLAIGPENFHRNRSKPLGFSTTCKACFKPLDKRDLGTHRKRSAKYYENNRQKKLAANKLWDRLNRRAKNRIVMDSTRRRRARDPVFRFSLAVSKSIRRALSGAKGGRGWQVLVGYSITELRHHLERQFAAKMSWKNYGEYWHVDHVIPISAFGLADVSATEDEILDRTRRCWALSNLRPLTVTENAKKGARLTLLC